MAAAFLWKSVTGLIQMRLLGSLVTMRWQKLCKNPETGLDREYEEAVCFGDEIYLLYIEF